MLEFMKQLRQVRIELVSSPCSCCFHSWCEGKKNYSFIFFSFLFCEQHVTVGVVGGSDLVKITEQLGKTGDQVSCFVTLHCTDDQVSNVGSDWLTLLLFSLLQ